MFIVRIDTGNAAFEADPAAELARILTSLAERVDSPDLMTGGIRLRDLNGNTVGLAQIVDED